MLVLEAAREWMRQDVGGKEAEEIIADVAVSADHFTGTPCPARWVTLRIRGQN